MMRMCFNALKRIISAAAILCAAALLSGCMLSIIQEDGVYEPFAQIDSEDGAPKDITATLYYRLANENYLVGIQQSVEVLAGERTEQAIIRTLLTDASQLPSGASRVFFNVDVSKVALDGDILYVTLSTGFIADSLPEDAEYAAGPDAEQELLYRRMLGVYSIVNSITGYSNGISVQLLIDDGAGGGTRPSCGELGLLGYDEDVPVEPLEFVSDVVATPEAVCDALCNRLEAGEYEQSYMLLAAYEQNGEAKPTYAEFARGIQKLGTVTGHSSVSTVEDDGETAVVSLTIELTRPDGTSARGSLELTLQRNDGILGVCYTSLFAALEGLQ